MEVRLQMPSSPPLDFNFHSTRSSPRSNSPSTSPKPFRNHFFFLSAPTSPNRSSEFHREFDDFSLIDQSSADADADADDFAFHVGEGIKSPSASAEELFDGGRIRSSVNAPAESYSGGSEIPPPGSPPPSKSKEKKSFWSQFTSITKKLRYTENLFEKSEQVRGRSRESGASGSRGARSLSPIRVSKYPWEEEKKAAENNTPSSSTALTLTTNSKSSSRRWRLRDLLLFRSASEGRAGDHKDPLRKMTAMYSRQQEIKSSSFGSVSRRRISAHEKHYAMKKAVSDDMKKKTFLPYKQGILGSFHGFGGQS